MVVNGGREKKNQPTDLTGLELLDREDLLAMVKRMVDGGVSLSFYGKRTAMEIERRVRPRVTRRIKELHVGTPEAQSKNVLMEGENLQAMVTLYKYRGQVDLIVTDPPYNTGQYFRYNDRWDEDPNDPDLGSLVTMEDGSRHTKWMKAMLPRLQMMRAMLKPGGVLAICIDDNELFHLGLMMDEVFGEENRLGIINWQKTSPKSQASHLTITTEYVLVYGRDASLSKTGVVPRSALSDARFGNYDNDELGEWKQDNLTGKGRSKTADYAIQSPFTGVFHNPDLRHWANKRSMMKQWLEEWGLEYEDCDIGDNRGIALAISGWAKAKTTEAKASLLAKAGNVASARLAQGNWSVLYWGLDGQQKPVRKSHRALVRQGAVPQSFWLEDDEAPPAIGAVSWLRSMSGRTRDGLEELNGIVGNWHEFETIKPLRLIKKIIQIWCPQNGLVLDPYAGSGTTGHAVLELTVKRKPIAVSY
jgi:adenine-specific DNA-methyltransferase